MNNTNVSCETFSELIMGESQLTLGAIKTTGKDCIRAKKTTAQFEVLDSVRQDIIICRW